MMNNIVSEDKINLGNQLIKMRKSLTIKKIRLIFLLCCYRFFYPIIFIMTLINRKMVIHYSNIIEDNEIDFDHMVTEYNRKVDIYNSL